MPSDLDRAERSRRRTEREKPGLDEPTVATPAAYQPAPRQRQTRAERTDVVPRRDWKPRADERRGATRPVRPRPGVRRVRRTIKHIDPLSVLKISAFFYAIFFVVWLFLAAILYWLVQGTGVLDAVAETSDLFADERIEITLGVVERWAFVIGLVLVVVGCIVNTVVAFLYNVASDLFGGVQVTFAERDN